MFKRILAAKIKKTQDLERIAKDKAQCKKAQSDVRDFLETTAIEIHNTLCMPRK